MTVAAGAKGSSTGSKVDSLTNSPTWGFQNRTVAYQSPRTIVGCPTSVRDGTPTRSRKLPVPYTTYTVASLASR